MCALRTGEPALIQGPIIFIQPKISSILYESVAQAMPLCRLSRPSQPGRDGCGLKRCEDESHADSDVSRSSGSVALVGTPSGGRIPIGPGSTIWPARCSVQPARWSVRDADSLQACRFSISTWPEKQEVKGCPCALDIQRHLVLFFS